MARPLRRVHEPAFEAPSFGGYPPRRRERRRRAQPSENDGFVLAPGSGDLLGSLCRVHVASFLADEDSSISTSPVSLRKSPVRIARRIRISMNHAVFW